MELATFLFLFLFTAAVISNGLVLGITLQSKRLRKLSYYNITSSLAVCDLLLMLVFGLHTTAAGNQGWPLGMEWCRILAALSYALGAITILHLCAIAIERYSVILKPFHYREEVNYRTFAVFMLVLWIFPIALALSPIVADTSLYVYNPDVFRCEFNWTDKSTLNLIYVAILAVMYFLVPIIIIGFTYGKMFSVAKSHFRQINSLRPTSVPDGGNRESNRLSKRACQEPKTLQQREDQQQQHQHQEQLEQRQRTELELRYHNRLDQRVCQQPTTPQQQKEEQGQRQQHNHQQQEQPEQRQRAESERNHDQQQKRKRKRKRQDDHEETDCENRHHNSARYTAGSQNRTAIRPRQIQALCPKAVKTIGVILVIYCLCYVPYSIVRIFKMFFPQEVPELVTTLTLLMALSSLTLNPIVYCFGKRDFRMELLKRLGFLGRLRGRGVVHPSHLHTPPGTTIRPDNGLEQGSPPGEETLHSTKSE